MNHSINNAKAMKFKLIAVISLILVSVTIVSCSKKDVNPDVPNDIFGNAVNETINGNAIRSDYDILSGAEYFRVSNKELTYKHPADVEGKPYCLVLPSEINGAKIESTYGLFDEYKNEEIVELYVPDGIKSCDISNCPKLEKLVLSDTVEELSLWNIGEESEGMLEIIWSNNENFSIFSLWNIYNIEELSMPEYINESEEGDFCFGGMYGFENLKSVILPQNINKIGGLCFSHMDALEKIEIPSSVTYIGGSSFCYCENLSEIILPEGLLEIGNDSFSNLPSCDYINVPDSVEKIGEGAFMDLKEYREDEAIYDNTVITLGVGKDTYAEQYAKENGIRYAYH